MLTSLATRFGRLKHWQIFVPIVVLQALAWLLDYSVLQEHKASPRELLVDDVEPARVGDMVLSMFSLAIILFWVWSIAYCSATRTSAVKNSAAIRAAIALLFFFAFFNAMPLFLQYLSTPEDSSTAWLFYSVLLILALPSFFYANGVAAKSLVSAEKGSVAMRREYLDTFYQIFLFPIGIWNVQSRMNALIDRVPSKLDHET